MDTDVNLFKITTVINTNNTLKFIFFRRNLKFASEINVFFHLKKIKNL